MNIVNSIQPKCCSAVMSKGVQTAHACERLNLHYIQTISELNGENLSLTQRQ